MNILLVEDELMVARRLMRMTNNLLGDRITKLSHVTNLDDAEALLAERAIDLLLLDLNLNNQSGFSLLQRAVAESFQTIIVSANTDQAIVAFEYGVVDFVPKPFNEQRLQAAFERLTHANHGHNSLKYLSVKKPHRIELLLLRDISFIKAQGNYSEIHTLNQQAHLHEKSMDKLASMLGSPFFRIHRSYMVNLDQFKSFHSYAGSKYEITLHNSCTVPVSRQRVAELKQRLGIQ